MRGWLWKGQRTGLLGYHCPASGDRVPKTQGQGIKTQKSSMAACHSWHCLSFPQPKLTTQGISLINNIAQLRSERPNSIDQGRSRKQEWPTGTRSGGTALLNLFLPHSGTLASVSPCKALLCAELACPPGPQVWEATHTHTKAHTSPG